MRRVVITGMGALTPVANGARASWDALVAGHSGIERITLFDPSPYPQQLVGEVKNFDNSSIDAKEVRHMDRYTQFALVAVQEALADSGYTITPENGPRTGVVIGSAVGGVTTLLAQQKVLEERGQRRLSPFFLSNMLADSATGQVAIATGAQGHNMAVVSACATGGHAIGEAFETIRRDDADVMLAGGAEAPIVPLIHAGFITMRALADDPDPHRASKPFTCAATASLCPKVRRCWWSRNWSARGARCPHLRRGGRLWLQQRRLPHGRPDRERGRGAARDGDGAAEGPHPPGSD